MSDDDVGAIIGGLIFLAIIALIIYLVVILMSVILAVVGGAGLIWGGGTATINYCKAFKENMIDSNLGIN